MKFGLIAPCAHCPFRTDRRFFLSRSRAQAIADSMTVHDAAFPCHKTTVHGDDGEVTHSEQTHHCAGALIMLEHMDRPNQLMRVAERVGLYSRWRLKMGEPVFTSAKAFVKAAMPDRPVGRYVTPLARGRRRGDPKR